MARGSSTCSTPKGLLSSLFFIILLNLSCTNLAAKTQIQDVSLTLLRGHDYKVGDNERTVMTFEYVNVGDWGDYFMFIDRLESDNGDGSTYMELSPRFKIHNFTDSIVKSIYISSTWEHSETSDHFLLGPGFDLNVAGFRFLKLNFYYRFNENYDDSYQLTPVWAIPFKIGEDEWLYDGFIDWSSSTDQKSASMSFTSQLKWNAKHSFAMQNNLYFGVEYIYWHNKFGIADVTENNINLLAKYHF